MSIEAMRKALNYIENTEGELGIKLSCGDALREALAAQPPAAPVETGRNRDPIHAPDGRTWYQTALDEASKRGANEQRIHELEEQLVAHPNSSAGTEGCGTPGCTDPNCDYGKGPLRCQSCGAVVVGEPQQSAASEPVAYQFRQRSAVGKGPQSSLPWCDWICIERDDYERYLREPNKLVQVRPLYADVPQAVQVPADQIARTLALSYGRDPDEMTEIREMCDADNRPVPIWRVYEEQAEALLASYSITRPHGGRE